jgi:hypothetical protein
MVLPDAWKVYPHLHPILTTPAFLATRFLTHEEALAVNPGLSEIVLKERAPLELPRTQINTNQLSS